MNDDEKILDISKKIEREKALINAANLMRQQTNNEAVRSKLDTQMREGRRNLEFFEERLRELQMRRLGQSVENMSLGGSQGGSYRGHDQGDDGSLFEGSGDDICGQRRTETKLQPRNDCTHDTADNYV